MQTAQPGMFMARESADAVSAFTKAALQEAGQPLGDPKAIYTIARGSSDAAANILSYEFMRDLGVPVTSLPPSVFSVGSGVEMRDSAALLISQSGASDDLVRSVKGARARGAKVVAITNHPDSPVEAASNATLPIGAGPEHAVPATKTVTGAIGAGAALLSAMRPDYAERTRLAVNALKQAPRSHPKAGDLQSALLRSRHVFVIGRDTGYGAAIETALKLKECCAIHAEAYSAAEVLHGPLQLATNPLLVLILDTGQPSAQDSLDQAETRFVKEGCDVYRLRPSDTSVDELTPAAAAAYLLSLIYPIVLTTALALGMNPDAPQTLSKVTQTT